MANMWDPDMIVGIDFGMTCSAVSYSLGPEWAGPHTIQHWPGRLGHEVRNKVDTSVSYDVRTNNLTTWGFLCNAEDENFEYNELFKLFLDPDYKDPSGTMPTIAEARKWYQDYLHCLYRFLIQHFGDTIARFTSKRIEYVFSVPVTWRSNPAVLAQMESLIHSAGFGQGQREHASIYLTEAEAAAIYASKQAMEKGEVYLVCDAGGGTTDLNVLKVESSAKGRLELEPLSWTEGAAVGSTLIDFRVRHMAKQRLATIQHHIQGNLDAVIGRMMRDKFETFKCSFGSPGFDVPKLHLPIPGLSPGMDFPQAGVEDSKLIITRDELRSVFDDQVNKMCDLIDKQIGLVRERHPREVISYLVLSGGLGSSPYVQSRIKRRYEQGSGGQFGATENMQVLIAPEPQLAVVHGLVMARTQASRGGPDVLSIRCCPISVGIVSREQYDPVQHIGELIVEDPFDKTRWAERQIRWVLVQGQTVKANEGASHRYRLKLPMGRERDTWKTNIVMSNLPVHHLPRSLKHEGAKHVCSVETVLEHRDMKRKNRHWYNFGQEYNRADFDIRMLVGAGIQFEIWGTDGIRSRAHDEIEVQWESADSR